MRRLVLPGWFEFSFSGGHRPDGLSKAIGAKHWWQVRVGQLSLCSPVLLLPLGVPLVPAPACLTFGHPHDSEAWRVLSTADVGQCDTGPWAAGPPEASVGRASRSLVWGGGGGANPGNLRSLPRASGRYNHGPWPESGGGGGAAGRGPLLLEDFPCHCYAPHPIGLHHHSPLCAAHWTFRGWRPLVSALSCPHALPPPPSYSRSCD